MRSAAGSLGSLLGRAWQVQQRRAVGNLPVKPNSFVESWGTRREHVENDFRWDTPTLTRLAVFAFGMPYAIYMGWYVPADWSHCQACRISGRCSGARTDADTLCRPSHAVSMSSTMWTMWPAGPVGTCGAAAAVASEPWASACFGEANVVQPSFAGHRGSFLRPPRSSSPVN